MAPVMMVMVMAVVVMMPVMVTRARRGLGHAPREQNGRSDHGNHGTRPGEKPQRRFLRMQHIGSPLEKYCRPCDK